MSLLAHEFCIVVDCGVAVVGHGKSLVDAINGVSKNITLRASSRNVKDAADAGKDSKKSLSVHVHDQQNGRVLPAEDCKVFWKSIAIKKEEREKQKKVIATLMKCFFMFEILIRN